MGAPGHLERSAPSEGQQQKAERVGAIQDQMRDPVSEGLGFARPCAGRDQQGRGRLCTAPDTVFYRAALRRVQIAPMPVAVDQGQRRVPCPFP